MKASLLRFALPAFCIFAAQLPGQTATPPPAGSVYTQSLTYLKIAPGKGNDWLKMTREEAMKTAQVRADAGEILTWTLLRSVFPAGEEARADYVISVITEGPPRRPGGDTALEADLKKAGLKMTADQYWAKRNGVVSRVASELWQIRQRVAAPQKGHYVHLNFMKVHDAAAYNDFEAKVWRPIAESWVKDGSMSGWLYATKILPTGTDTAYTGYSADMYPTWEAAFASRSLQAAFEKVHPGKSYQEASASMPKLRSLAKRELWVVVERVEKAKK
jgi:hypothetical protein